ncbi:MAG: PAS domain-containing protein [Desulfobacterales bacterium]|nr:MAG: PAS domain-containing protein [Desulfobacterales bacterium]
MVGKENDTLSTTQLAMVIEKIPVGITVIDLKGHVLYYNEYCSKFVDRKPEYIGQDIRICHKKPESIVKIDRILTDIKEGKTRAFYYETVRSGKKLVVTISPYEANGQLIGFIQSFVIKQCYTSYEPATASAFPVACCGVSERI